MYVDLKLEEVDRGKLKLGQDVRIRVDAIPDKEFTAELDWISPIAALVFKGGSTAEKTFPARATIKNLDARLRPGMSASTEIIIETRAERAADSGARQLREGRQAGGVSAGGQEVRDASRSRSASRTMKTSS